MYPLLFIATQLGDPDDVPPPPPPDDPVQLAPPYSYDVEVMGTDQINHTWSAVANASGYVLKGWDGSAWVTIQSFGSGATSHSETGLDVNTLYERKLIATGDGVNFLDSEEVYINAITEDSAPAFQQQIEAGMLDIGATEPQKMAIRTFLQDALDNNYDEKLKAIWLHCVGSSLTNKLKNLLDSEDLDAAFRAETITGISSVTKGIQVATANVDALDYNLPLDDLVGTPVFGVSYYVQTACYNVLGNGDATFHLIHFSPGDSKAYPNFGRSSSGTTRSVANAAGLHRIQREDMNTVKGYQNGTLAFTDSQVITPITSPEDTSHYFPATNMVLNVSHANLVVSAVMVHDPFDSVEGPLFDAAFQQLMTDLSVNV